MLVRNFVKRSIELKRKLFLILLSIAIISGAGAFALQYYYGESSVYRNTTYYEVKPYIDIYTAGMPVEITTWNGDEIRIECVAELPLIVNDEDELEIIISQDDSFAISIFTLDMFRYKMKVYLPQNPQFSKYSEHGKYQQINVVSAGGNVDFNSYQLDCERVGIETKNADVNVIRATNLYVISTRSGNVYMDFDFLESANVIETESGDVQIKIPDYEAAQINSKLRVTTKTGNYTIIEKDMDLPENYPLL